MWLWFEYDTFLLMIIIVATHVSVRAYTLHYSIYHHRHIHSLMLLHIHESWRDISQCENFKLSFTPFSFDTDFVCIIIYVWYVYLSSTKKLNKNRCLFVEYILAMTLHVFEWVNFFPGQFPFALQVFMFTRLA